MLLSFFKRVDHIKSLFPANIPNSTDTFIRWNNAFNTLNMTFVGTLQYSIMIFCGYKLYYEMEEKLSIISDDSRKLHRQIVKTLLLQIITPTIVMYSPVFLVIYLPLLNLDFSLPMGIFLGIFSFYPALGAFILMYVVTDYRRAIKDVLKVLNPFKKVTVSTLVVIPGQAIYTISYL
ncbi:Seven TM Receptor [Caenorhabditis elegans]|uniref:Seven TM Receptor n=1 Tax=Caenorhabditis elegans TaxID=6239 RepID=O44455_CAEEL|nr:Seven TM Receptor [Caenorhabditis elegans]CCD62203.1 Seven TM Receptor [Caenorhabditis elegans]|eukprot:NP_500344.2 Uncharacterized protein CELE_C04C3.7 [Caenorhabditis elegans]